MKIEILFRGQKVGTKEWVYGYYYSECGCHYIIEDRQKDNILNRNLSYEVYPESVGRLIMKKNNVNIFEGDLLKIPENDTCREGIHEVFYYEDSFVTSSVLFTDKETANKHSLTWVLNRGAKVIGNIHDNPELIK